AGKEYKRISAHIGLFPAVMSAPSDQTLITGGSEERRRFIDMIISQADAPYLEALIQYNQALEQRNRMLKDGFTDPMLFESVEIMMERSSAIIRKRRAENVEKLRDIFISYYAQIAGEEENIGLEYVQSGKDFRSLSDAFESSRSRDMALKFTTIGPHRDDLSLTLSAMPAKQTASQGQMKTFTIALRLAQYEFLRNATSQTPILLLDDIFDKLDAIRVERIMKIVGRESFGQIFITDTNRKHLDEIMALSGPDYKMWSVSNGAFTQV
ncbi:MAG: DNA replication and repair protein RecF, partial [Muribaculum sp.]|nr:DNA replication and repair protein RecF [Muribaculum sp.]